ncbi:hypothetical protein H1R20_g8367, partial [Candolleomyces eurysporus]
MLTLKSILSLLAPIVCLATVVSALPAHQLDKRAKAQVFRSCTVPNTVALTFDDGPYSFGNDLVNMLNAAGVKGTFFLSTFYHSLSASTTADTLVRSDWVDGNNWACIYNEDMSRNIKHAFDTGHQIASHTWSHKDLRTLSWDQLHDEMWRVEQAIQRITGAMPAFVRPPFGDYNDLVLEAAGARGQTIANWDFDSEDGKSATVARQKGLYDAVVAAHPSSILSLQHEVHQTSVYEVLPYAIEKLKGAGYRFVTVSECLNIRPYQTIGAPAPRDVSFLPSFLLYLPGVRCQVWGPKI